MTIVPDIVSAHGAPIALDPLIADARIGGHAVVPRRRRFANANAEGDLRIGERCGSQQ
jgi:hypothetical protein